MHNSTVIRVLLSWLALVILSSGYCSPVWAQVKATGNNPIASPQGTGQLVLGPATPNPACPNTAVTFRASGPCGSWDWDAGGGTIISRSTVPNSSSTVTIRWPQPGTYTVTVNTDCAGTNYAQRTVTIVDTTPGAITTTGSASQITATSATICLGNSLQLVPPPNSSNWAWSGANVVAVDGNGVATVQPFAEVNTYSLTYSPAGSSCSTTSAFVVNVAQLPAQVAVGNNTPSGNWRFGSGNLTLSVQNPDPNYLYSWYADATSTTVLYTGSDFTPSLSKSSSYYVSATSCQETSRTRVDVVVRGIQLLVGGMVPAAAIHITSGTAVVLQASTTTSSSSFTWFLNDLEIKNQTGSQLSVTQPGRYTVRVQYPTDASSFENSSQPVDIVDGLAGQLANGQALTYLNDVQVLKAGITTADQVAQLAATDRTQQLTYLTGWAQPLQQVNVQAGPAQEDLVQHYAYAGMPTTNQSYLPFSLTSQVKATGLYEPDPVAKGNSYYGAVDNQPYGTSVVEASPLGRPLSQTQAGSTWAGHPTQVSYATNTSQDGVRQWQGLDGSAQYGAGQLNKEVVLDADNRRTEVYKDPLGRVVLQRKITGYGGSSPQNFDTYSLYAPAGYLQYVIPPAAVAAMAAANNWSVANMPANFAGQWLYQYTYDDWGRLVERKFPGAAAVYLVYDRFDRPVLVQDGNHRAANQWLFTKFDAQNRAVVSGLYAYASQATTARQDLQNLADSSPLTAEFESRRSGGYSMDQTFPAVQDGSSGAVVLSMTFFDDYDLDQDAKAAPDYAYAAQSLGSDPQPVATTQLRGLQTMTQTRVVQPGGQYGSWLTTVLFYDEYGNLIQKQSNNLMQSDRILRDITTLVYRQQGFVPQVVRSLKTQQTAGSYPVVSVRNRFTYDAAGRPLTTWQQHLVKGNWEPEVLVSSNRYTGLGELTQKKLHSRDGVKFLQTEDFTYNLHGQLKSINDGDNLLVSNPDNDLFALAISREQSGQIGNAPRYDGGISAVSWVTHNAAQANQPERQRSYRFSYDGLGRMTDALYQARNRPWENYTSEQGGFDEKGITYDPNGNITTIKRYTKANDSAAPTVLDDLSFTYTNSGNQHSKVDDLSGDPMRGFKDARTVTEYAYDPNGSITRDDNKNATYTYNALNKVEKLGVGNSAMSYIYDASGTVLSRTLLNNGVPAKTDYYIDGFVYLAAPGFTGLVSVPTPEGRAVGSSTYPTLTYEYHMRDHLGNLRVAFRAQAGTENLGLSSENPSQEEGAYPKFQNVGSTQSQGTSAYHGSYVAAVTRTQLGPAITIPVSHLDHLKVRVYYKTPAGVQTSAQPVPSPIIAPAAAVGLAVAPSLLPTASSVDGRPTRAAPGVQLSLTGLLSRLAAPRQPAARSQVVAAPLGSFDAYISWTLKDSKGQVISSGCGKQTAPVTASSWNSWTKLDLPLNVDLSSDEARTGTLTIQEVNDGSQAVYFDSLTITHPLDKALVTQENHYYPLGMALSGVAVNTVPVANLSKEQFNEGSTLQDELLGTEAGIYSTFYRSYDPATGRFTGVDPLADHYAAWTPYQFALGNPIAMNDPTGALSQQQLAAIIDELWAETYSGSGGGDNGGSLGSAAGASWSAFDGSIGKLYQGADGGYQVVFTHEAQLDTGLRDTNNQPITIGSGEFWNTSQSLQLLLSLSDNQPNMFATMQMAASEQDPTHAPSADDPNPNRNPNDDRLLRDRDIDRLKNNGWDHGDKGKKGGRYDLYKDRPGNIYKKPKGNPSDHYGEPIHENMNDLRVVAPVLVVAGVIIAVLLAPETGGMSLVPLMGL